VKTASVLLALALVASVPSPGRADPDPGNPVVDLDVQLPFQLVTKGRALEWGLGQASAAQMRRGGVYGVVLGLGRGRPSDERALTSDYLAVQRGLARSSELRLPGCGSKRPGVRTWLSIADSSSFAGSPNAPALWKTRGVRFFGLIGRRDNALGTAASTPEPVVTGLTDAGKEVVKSVHRAGGIVDVSGTSAMTFREVVQQAREDGVPVVATHSGARALADDPSNLDDGQLRDIASTGGVVGLSLDQNMLTRGRETRLPHVIRQVRHLVRVAGPDHVAIGSGYENIQPPTALANASRFPRLGNALQASGLSRRTIRKVFAGNALRLLCR
jgi:membrane dipeptidase